MRWKPNSKPAPLDLRPLAVRVASGDAVAVEEMKRIIAELRATATVTPGTHPDELDPEWQGRFLGLVEQVQRAVPEEWSEEELQDQIAQAIAEVRATGAVDKYPKSGYYPHGIYSRSVGA